MYFFKKYSINIDTHTRINNQSYEYIYHTYMGTSERLSQIYLKIHEIGQQERLIIDEDVTS
jgi:hypothetical protein